jgi:hypothetical protein
MTVHHWLPLEGEPAVNASRCALCGAERHEIVACDSPSRPERTTTKFRPRGGAWSEREPSCGVDEALLAEPPPDPHTWVESHREHALIAYRCTACQAVRREIVAYDYSRGKSRRITVGASYGTREAGLSQRIPPCTPTEPVR